jgi:hypothetical protein
VGRVASIGHSLGAEDSGSRKISEKATVGHMASIIGQSLGQDIVSHMASTGHTFGQELLGHVASTGQTTVRL